MFGKYWQFLVEVCSPPPPLPLRVYGWAAGLTDEEMRRLGWLDDAPPGEREI